MNIDETVVVNFNVKIILRFVFWDRLSRFVYEKDTNPDIPDYDLANIMIINMYHKICDFYIFFLGSVLPPGDPVCPQQ